MDSSTGTVSLLIAQVRSGCHLAMESLHNRYWHGLVEIARRRLLRTPSVDRDAEDIAQEVFITVYDSLSNGRLPRLRNREHWLAFLTHVVSCKVVNACQFAAAKKRGGLGNRVGLTCSQDVISREYSPDQRAMLRDCYEYYLASLPLQLRRFAELHLAGLNNGEIAEELGCVRRTVDRKMQLLRLYWGAIAKHQIRPEVQNEGDSSLDGLSQIEQEFG